MGRFVSATGQFLLATNGQFSCPPTGSFRCPLTARLDGKSTKPVNVALTAPSFMGRAMDP